MADNYLERKMEDYRKGSPRHYTPKLTPAGRKPGMLCIPVEPRPVLIAAPDSRLLEELTRLLAEAGCRVAVMCRQPAQGTALARQYGALYHPGDPEAAGDLAAACNTLQQRWGGVAAVFASHSAAAGLQLPGCPRIIATSDSPEPKRALYYTLAEFLSPD